MLLELLGISTDKAIVFRSILAYITTFFFALYLLPFWIFSQRIKSIYERIEQRYNSNIDDRLSSKKNTPTTGGIMLFLSTLGGVVIVTSVTREPHLTIIAVFSIFMAVGLSDDIMKYFKKGKGLNIFSKLILLVVGSGFSSYMIHNYLYASIGSRATMIDIPFIGFVDLGPWYFLVLLFGYLIVVNGVNFSDGLDGLAAGTFCISLMCLIVIAYVSGRVDFSDYLGIPYVSGSAELTIFLTALFGAILGFLWFNFNPAQIFMGDCGSLALGSILVSVTAMTKTELMLIGIAGVYIFEFLSSLLQVLSFKFTRKRIFSAAPFHYIFLKKDIPENKITLRIMMIHFIFCASSFFLLKV